MIDKRLKLPNLERDYFARFAGEQYKVYRCQNCGARFLAEEPPRDPNGRTVCCAACVFDPAGCRCFAGEWGVTNDHWVDFAEADWNES
jgi:DNA-directed RNA polymerase subunit RPC12/RpoP